MDEQTTERTIAPWGISYEERVRRRHLRQIRRNYHSSAIDRGRGIVAEACSWLLPWTVKAYPGIWRGVSQMLGNRVQPATVGHWRANRMTPGVWALIALADEIGRRARRGLELEAALRVEAAGRILKPRGLQIRDPETGLPKYRHRLGSGAPGTAYARRKERQAAESRPVERKL